MNARQRILLCGGRASAPASRIAGRLRSVGRHLCNDAGWLYFDGVSDFGAVGHTLHGRVDQVRRRFQRYAACGRNAVRIAGMLSDPSWVARDLLFSPRDPGYWPALQQTIAIANGYGMYVEFFMFADAQIGMPDPAEREDTTYAFASEIGPLIGVLPQMANEPYKNGWENCVDPALLSLSDLFRSLVGHREFSIGDPGDVYPTVETEFETCAQHVNLNVVHPNRDQPAGDPRWRRWIDHLEGFSELKPTTNPDAHLILDEPIGAHPQYQPGRRDNDPEAFLAGMVVARCVGYGFTHHWIVEEDGQCDVMDLPGLSPEIGAVLAQVNDCAGPEWVYMNDSWAGAPTNGITWSGLEGKVRHRVCGNRAYSVAYGEADFGNAVRWNPGWTPRELYRGQRVCVWAVNQ